MPKDAIFRQAEASVQSEVDPRQDADYFVGTGLWFWMNSGSLISPWWSTTRDQQLRAFAKQSDHFQGALWMIATKLTSVPFRVEPRDPSIKLHHKQADIYQQMLAETVQFGQGWAEVWSRFWYDAWTQDNGGFMEVLGAGRPDKEIRGPAFGLAHLDASRCTRTSNPVYPVVYTDPTAGKFKFHHTRIIFTSQQPSTSAQMNGVGHCWLTRAYNATQNLVDIATYKEEKLGSRPPRQIIIGKGIDTAVLLSALKMAAHQMDNEALSRFAKSVVVGSVDPNFDISLLDLASVPDGFDERTSVELGMALIALAGGFPPRWLWPATATGATKADAIYSHIAGSGGGAAWHIQKMQNAIGGSERGRTHVSGKVLPPHLKLIFDYQDDEQDRAQADIRETRAKRRQVDIQVGVIDVRTARQQAVSAGDLSDDQYEYLERKDGRLEDGTDLLTLFESPDPLYVKLLDLKTEFSPLLIEAHEPLEMMIRIDEALVNAARLLHKAIGTVERKKIEQASDALSALKAIFEPLVAEQVMTEEAAEGGGQTVDSETDSTQATEERPIDATSDQSEPGASEDEEVTEGEEEVEEEVDEVDEEVEEEEEGDEEVEQEKAMRALAVFDALRDEYPAATDEQLIDAVVKSFNFGARVGEVIRGALARGEGGRFANAAELEAGRLAMIRRILGKLGAKISGGGSGSQAEAKKLENQQKVAEALAARGIEPGTLEALNAMRGGELPDGATLASLVARGLAQQNPDGTYNMTPDGRALRAAGDSGDVDRATGIVSPKAEGAGKKPSGGGGGAKPKPSAEQAAEEKRKREGVERAEKREQAFRDIERDTGVSADDLTELTQYLGEDIFGSDGTELGSIDSLSPDVAKRLAAAGLVKFDSAGNAIVSSAGRSLVSASEKGDKSRIASAVSTGREAVNRTHQQIDERSERANEAREKADGYRDQISGLEAEAADKVAEQRRMAEEAKEEADNLRAELEKTTNQRERDRIEDEIRNAEQRIQMAGEAVKGIEKDLADSTETLRERLEREEERALDYEEQVEDLKREIGESDETKSIGDFGAGIRAVVRGYWSGALDEFGFVDSMISAINRGFTQAWNEGAAECGIQPDELSQDEKDALQRFINDQTGHIFNYGRDIAIRRDVHQQSPRDPAGKLDPLLSRAELWINRYNEASQRAKSMACADKKMKWVLGEAEHCASCLKLDGKIKRMSFWTERGIIPQVAGAEYLECKGFRCQCNLEETTDKLSPGPLPRLP